MAISLINNCSDEQFKEVVQESLSIVEIEEKLGYNSYSGSVASKIKDRINKLELDTSHFSSRQIITRTEENIFIENSTAAQAVLRKWYKKGEYTPYIFSICGQEPFWNNKELTLILDHINGKNRDDRLENLRWVCPNCNQQLETTGSKNKAYKEEKVINRCVDCGKEIQSRSTRCKACAGKLRSQETVLPCTREELKMLIRMTPFTKIGEKYGVSDNAIRKWCVRFNLPSKVSEIKAIDDKVWEKM